VTIVKRGISAHHSRGRRGISNRGFAHISTLVYDLRWLKVMARSECTSSQRCTVVLHCCNRLAKYRKHWNFDPPWNKNASTYDKTKFDRSDHIGSIFDRHKYYGNGRFSGDASTRWPFVKLMLTCGRTFRIRIGLVIFS